MPLRRRSSAGRRTGIPDNPGAWIVTTARNRAIDRIRRERVLADKTAVLARLESLPVDPDEMSALPDERLALVFTCCHPALAADVQIALTLRIVGGLTTTEIAVRVPRPGADDGAAARARQEQDPDGRDPVPGPGRRDPARPPQRRAAGDLPDLQRGLRVEPRRVARSPRPLQRGDPAREAALRADARRARGVRAAGADAAAGLPPRRAPLARRRARAARRPGPRPLGCARDRRGPADARARRGVPPARALPAAGGDRRRPRPGVGPGDRGRGVRGAAATRRHAGRPPQPRRRRRARRRRRGGRAPDRRDRRARRVPPLPLGQGRPPPAPRPLRGGGRRLPARARAHRRRAGAAVPRGTPGRDRGRTRQNDAMRVSAKVDYALRAIDRARGGRSGAGQGRAARRRPGDPAQVPREHPRRPPQRRPRREPARRRRRLPARPAARRDHRRRRDPRRRGADRERPRRASRRDHVRGRGRAAAGHLDRAPGGDARGARADHPRRSRRARPRGRQRRPPAT